MQTWQKVWPQGVSSGCTNGCKQSGRVIAWDEKKTHNFISFFLHMPKVFAEVKILKVNKEYQVVAQKAVNNHVET